MPANAAAGRQIASVGAAPGPPKPALASAERSTDPGAGRDLCLAGRPGVRTGGPAGKDRKVARPFEWRGRARPAGPSGTRRGGATLRRGGADSADSCGRVALLAGAPLL